MSEDITPKELLESNCSTNSEPFALQNLGIMMEPEFSENCIIIIDPGMALHNMAYALIEFEGELYFRQYLERGNDKFMVCLNPSFPEIELKGNWEHKGCIVQQKQRKQKPLHYYHLNSETKEMDFSLQGKIKEK
jgi:SOS-response transcriptional repressor LexA